MGEELLKALPVLLASMIKFILGPVGGHVAKLHFITTVIVTIVGMMSMVVAFTYFGDWIKSRIKFFKKRKKFTARNRRFVQIWKKFGLAGVAFLLTSIHHWFVNPERNVSLVLIPLGLTTILIGIALLVATTAIYIFGRNRIRTSSEGFSSAP